MAHVTTAAMMVYFLEALKRMAWLRWVRMDTKAVNRILSAVLAAVAAAGIDWTYDPTVGKLVIEGLTWGAVGTMAWEWCKQFATQQLLFDGIVRPDQRRHWDGRTDRRKMKQP